MSVNGRIVREPGTQIDPGQDKVAVRGRPIPGASALRYWILHKPVGFLTTLNDPEGRRTVKDLMPPGPRLFPVGRLDADTSGLLLLTNDGELAHRLMHPRYGVEKTYLATVNREPDESMIRRLRRGVELEGGGRSSEAYVRVLAAREGKAVLEVRIGEGRYRQVRRMCEQVGLDVKKLHRVAYGPLRLSKLPKGASRPLTPGELRILKQASARPGGTSRPPAEPERAGAHPRRGSFAPKRGRPRERARPPGRNARRGGRRSTH